MSGGVGELWNYWGNTYFNDTYTVNNKPTKFKGIAAQHPYIVKSLLDANAEYIAETKKIEEYCEFIPIYAGCKGHKKPLALTTSILRNSREVEVNKN